SSIQPPTARSSCAPTRRSFVIRTASPTHVALSYGTPCSSCWPSGGNVKKPPAGRRADARRTLACETAPPAENSRTHAQEEGRSLRQGSAVVDRDRGQGNEIAAHPSPGRTVACILEGQKLDLPISECPAGQIGCVPRDQTSSVARSRANWADHGAASKGQEPGRDPGFALTVNQRPRSTVNQRPRYCQPAPHTVRCLIFSLFSFFVLKVSRKVKQCRTATL